MGKFPPGGGTRFLKRQGGQLQEGESRFPNHLVKELSKNQKLIHETSCFKQFRPIFRSKSQNLWRYAPFPSQIGCSPLYHGVNIAETTHTPRPQLYVVRRGKPNFEDPGGATLRRGNRKFQIYPGGTRPLCTLPRPGTIPDHLYWSGIVPGPDKC